MPGVQEIRLPQGICWESHDEPGKEPRRRGTAVLSTRDAQPGSLEDSWWPLSLAVTLVPANPNSTSPQSLGGVGWTQIVGCEPSRSAGDEGTWQWAAWSGSLLCLPHSCACPLVSTRLTPGRRDCLGVGVFFRTSLDVQQ